jgi:chaperone modulatory protein CbpM
MSPEDVVWLDEQRVVTLAELVEVSGLDEAELLELVRAGVIQGRESGGDYSFSARVVTVARNACRLRDDFELEGHGLGVALRLLERVRDLEREIARLRARTPGS